MSWSKKCVEDLSRLGCRARGRDVSLLSWRNKFWLVVVRRIRRGLRSVKVRLNRQKWVPPPPIEALVRMEQGVVVNAAAMQAKVNVQMRSQVQAQIQAQIQMQIQNQIQSQMAMQAMQSGAMEN